MILGLARADFTCLLSFDEFAKTANVKLNILLYYGQQNFSPHMQEKKPKMD